MRVVTAADHRMKDWCERCVEAASKYYPVDVYDLGGLGFGKPLKPHDKDMEWDKGYLPCLFKIDAIEDALKHGDPVLWLDSDCIMQRHVDEMMRGWGCAVVAIRREGDVGAGLVNTGVMLWKDSQIYKPLEMIHQWRAEARALGSEQSAFNALLNKNPEFCTLISTEYNDYYFDTPGASIIHYKTDKRHLWKP